MMVGENFMVSWTPFWRGRSSTATFPSGSPALSRPAWRPTSSRWRRPPRGSGLSRPASGQCGDRSEIWRAYTNSRRSFPPRPDHAPRRGVRGGGGGRRRSWRRRASAARGCTVGRGAPWRRPAVGRGTRCRPRRRGPRKTASWCGGWTVGGQSSGWSRTRGRARRKCRRWFRVGGPVRAARWLCRRMGLSGRPWTMWLIVLLPIQYTTLSKGKFVMENSGWTKQWAGKSCGKKSKIEKNSSKKTYQKNLSKKIYQKNLPKKFIKNNLSKKIYQKNPFWNKNCEFVGINFSDWQKNCASFITRLAKKMEKEIINVTREAKNKYTVVQRVLFFLSDSSHNLFRRGDVSIFHLKRKWLLMWY